MTCGLALTRVVKVVDDGEETIFETTRAWLVHMGGRRRAFLCSIV